MSLTRAAISALAGSVLGGSSQLALVALLSALFPILIPLIFSAYFLLRYLDAILDGYKDYEKLKKTMSEERALAIASGKVIVGEALREATGNMIDSQTTDKLSVAVIDLVQSDRIQDVVKDVAAYGVDKQLIDNMLQSTLFQFVKGAVEESTDELIRKAVKEFLE